MPHRVLIGPPPRIAVEYEGAGALLLFLHGIGGNRTNWREQMTEFAPHFLAVAWDARGYGESDRYTGPLQFAALAADVKRVLDHFGARRAHLVGLSMGGMIALDFYKRHPDRVASLVISNSTARYRDVLAPGEKIEDFLRIRLGPMRAGRELHEFAPSIARSCLSPKATSAAYQRLVDSVSAVCSESYVKSYSAVATCDVSDTLGDIAVPTLVMTGADDPLSTPEIARQLMERIPDARFAVIEGAGHLSNFERPEAFNRVVLDFLLSVREGTQAPPVV